MLIIEILHNKECGAWQALSNDLKYWLRIWGFAHKSKVKTVLISEDAEASKHGFFGSPQVMINGRDIDAESINVKKYHVAGCRLYSWESKTYESPPREMLEKTILQGLNK